MVWEHLNKELILPQIDAKDSADIFEQAGGKLVSLGYCKDSYVEALKLREKDFPTGVDMGGVGVAIPHTDVSHVLKKGIVIATTKKPVTFVQMGTDDEMRTGNNISFAFAQFFCQIREQIGRAHV